MFQAVEAGISSGGVGRLARVQTLLGLQRWPSRLLYESKDEAKERNNKSTTMTRYPFDGEKVDRRLHHIIVIWHLFGRHGLMEGPALKERSSKILQ